MEVPADSASLRAAPVTASLGPTGPLLRQLHLLDSLPLPEGVTAGDVRILKQDLEVLCASLKDVSEAQDPSFTAKWWMKEVRDICYDTEDYLDEVMFAGARKGAQSEQEWRSRISELLALVKDAIGRSQLFQLGQTIKPQFGQASSVHEGSYRDTGGRGWLSCTDGLVEEPMMKLVKLLAFDDEKQLKIVPISGFAGVGKTTAARTLYQKFGGKFKCRAFLRVTRKPDMIRLLTSMLSQIKAPRTHAFADVQDLIDSIKEHLQGKRYFIIIDDLWTTSVWNIISRAFPDGDCSSRIITTTQIEDVALACSGYVLEYIFEMSPLNYGQSRKLFLDRVFGSQGEGGCPKELGDVSDRIISKCGGSPLATVIIARLLASEPILLKQHREHIHQSLSSTLGTNSTSEGMKEVVKLIYNNLPPRLKTCLLYLSLYPEGYTIRKDELVKLWVAEGFICAVQGQDTEEIAGGYFDDLASRGMIQPVDTHYNDEVLSCTVHHTVLDLIRYKSMEENFIVVVNYFQTTLGLPHKVRRLSVQFGGAKSAEIPESIMTSHVRSLLFCGFFRCVPPIAGHRLLRVLILHIWGDQNEKKFDLTGICELFRLKYLKIVCNITVALPEKIQRLHCLETLEVDASVAAIPSDIVHFKKLQHLLLPSEANLPHDIHRMTSLRTLGYFDLSSNSTENVMNLGELTNLQDLQLTCCIVQPPADNQEDKMKCLGSILEKLRKLKSVTLVPTGSSHANALGASSTTISCDGLGSLSSPPALLQRFELSPRICIFSSLPKWIGELSNLCILKIAVRELSNEDIDILKVVPALTALSLYVWTTPVKRIIFGKNGFPVLRYFKFTCTAPYLAFVEGAMPNVRRLKLRFNAKSLQDNYLRHARFAHLSGLEEISAKIWGIGDDEYDRENAERALNAAFKNRPRNPIINVQSMDWIIYGDGEESTAAQKQNYQTPDKQDKITEEGSVEQHGDTSKQAESRTLMPLESTSRLQNPDNKPSGSSVSGPGMPLPSNISTKKQTVPSLQSTSSKSLRAVKKQLLMEDPATISATVGLWGMKAAGWIASSIISEIFKKGYDYLSFDVKMLNELEPKVLLLERVTEVVEKCPDRPRLEQLFEELKSAFYEAEDILDDIEYHRLEKQIQDGNRKSFVPKSSPLKNKLKESLDKIETVINDAYKILEGLNLPSLSNDNRSQAVAANSRGSVTTAAPPPVVIGRDEECEKIIAMLHDKEGDGQSLCYSVLGIYGIGGSGKSTLAQLVCAREKKDSHFDLVMWVYVSQDFSVPNIFSQMIEEATGEPSSEFESLHNVYLEWNLYDELRGLRGKRFLLVLDDVWNNIMDWRQELLSPLRVGEAGSKILVTSRTQEGLLAVGAPKQRCIPISELDEDVFLKLFMHYVGAMSDDGIQKLFESAGAEIAKMLRKSPLAASTVGPLLGANPRLDFWKTTQNWAPLNEMMGALWWSYQHLDEHVRRCFAFCSIFPRGHGLKRDELVHLWVAGGFIKNSTNAWEEMEDVGQGYFNELVSASFLKPGGWGKEYYVVHDLLHDLAEKVAGCDCFRIEKGWTGEVPPDVRHLYIETYDESMHTEKDLGGGNVRTLIIKDTRVEEKSFEGMLKRLPKLRVLTVRAHIWTYIPSIYWSVEASIGQLKHLRYLRYIPSFAFPMGLSRKPILPGIFAKLYHMQVLDFGVRIEGLTELVPAWDNRWNNREVAAEVLEGLCPPMGLQRLEIKYYEGSRYPNWMVDKQNGGPEDLHELVLHKCEQLEATPALFQVFTGLRSLSLSCCSGWNALPDNIRDLTKLEKLKIEECWEMRSLPDLPLSLKYFELEFCNREFMESCVTTGDPNWEKIQHIPNKRIHQSNIVRRLQKLGKDSAHS